MIKRTFFGAFILVAVLSRPLQADDWPQWLGPQRDGVWREHGILREFPAGGPFVLWRIQIGAGFSGPTVSHGRVYLTDRRLAPGSTNQADPFARGSSTGIEGVSCLDEVSGKELWRHTYECRYTISYGSGPRVAPLVDQGRVYTLGAEGNLLCLNATNGSLLWSRDLKADFHAKTPMWGFAGHPLIDGDNLICLVGGPGSVLVAFDKNNGKERWRALDASEPGYSSPVIYEFGKQQLLVLFHPEAANALDPKNGKVIWSVPFKSNSGLSVATPRRLANRLFFTSFYNGSLMLELGADDPSPKVLWRTAKADERNTTHLNSIIPTPFLENGYIYGVCSYGQLRCLNVETGERVWETFKATTGDAPVRWANAFLVKHEDRFFVFNEKGDLIIAKLSPAGYEEISRAHLLDPTNKDPGRAVVWSHPAFANRHIYVRNDRELICADLSAK